MEKIKSYDKKFPLINDKKIKTLKINIKIKDLRNFMSNEDYLKKIIEIEKINILLFFYKNNFRFS
jgi:hypothetical protein